MLAYLLWHRPAEGVEREVYERALERFHRSLAHSPPAGFRGSAAYRSGDLPWLGRETGHDDSHQTGYEDWYLVDDFAALGVLNEAAVAHGHRTAHDGVAHRFGGAAGGLYGLLEGHADLAAASLIVWVSRPPLARPPGAEQGALGALLGDGMDPRHASLWRRALVLGPAPEYCLLARESPAGVAPTRLPEGWRATTYSREALFGV